MHDVLISALGIARHAADARLHIASDKYFHSCDTDHDHHQIRVAYDDAAHLSHLIELAITAAGGAA